MQILFNEKKKELIQPVRRYNNQVDKAKELKKMATVKIGQKNAATKLLERKKLIEDQVAQFKLIQEKQLAALEKTNEELITRIESFCEKNKDLFKELNGVSEESDKLLSGDINYVLYKIKPEDIGKIFNDLTDAYTTDSIDKLKEFYKSDFSKDKKNTFEDYLKDNEDNDILEKMGSLKDENGNFSLNKVSDDKKELCEMLDLLKNMYTMLFKVNDKIKIFKEESDKNLKNFNKSLEILDERLNSNNSAIEAIKKINKKMSRINTFA